MGVPNRLNRDRLSIVPNNTPEYQSQYYRSNEVERKRKIVERQRDIRDQVQAIKVTAGCSVCGYRKSPRALQFHHVSNDKEGTIARWVTQGHKLTKILAEIEKCIVLCANCHAELHD